MQSEGSEEGGLQLSSLREFNSMSAGLSLSPSPLAPVPCTNKESAEAKIVRCFFFFFLIPTQCPEIWKVETLILFALSISQSLKIKCAFREEGKSQGP